MNILRKTLKIVGIVAGTLLLLLLGLLGYASLRWDAKVERTVPAFTAKTDSATLDRGKFLYTSSLACWTCHSSGGGETQRPSGGLKFDLSGLSPSLGIYYARNITPDVETGIGSWTDGEIVRALREGISKDGRVLFPIMPMDPLHGLSDDDALALVAYLRSLPPVKNKVPDREPSLFAKTLMTVGMIGPMKAITMPVVAPPRAITPEYGGYVTRHASLCSDCHTPRNLMNGDFYYDSLLAGSSFTFGDKGQDAVFSWARNITPDNETGIGTWSEEQFVMMMRTGLGPDGKVRTKHMPYAYYGLWDSVELKAVYQYIRTLKPVHRTVPASAFDPDTLAAEPVVKGRGLFNSTCVACHGPAGNGALPTHVVLAEVAPSFSDEELIEFIMKGNTDLRMPGFAKTFSEDELKAVIAYIRTWRHGAPGQ